MDVSGLRKKSITAWIPVDDEVKFLGKHLDQQRWEELKAQATVTEVIDAAAGTTKENFDAVEFRHLVGREVVLDIAGLTDGVDEAEQPLPLAITPDNIDMLMDQWTEFRMAVMSTPLVLKKMLQLQAEQAVKNS